MMKEKKMTRPKITITKLFRRGSLGHFRYYSPFFDPSTQTSQQKPKAITFDLEGGDNRYGDISFIKTEKELCKFILDNFGDGIYRVIGHIKGRHGAHTFWRGEITREGFVFFKRDVSVMGIKKLMREMNQATTEEEKIELQQEIDVEREINNLNKPDKHGFTPFLLASSRRGELVSWDTPDFAYQKREAALQQDLWNMPINKKEEEKDSTW